jgi:hypothetical protein
MCQRCNEARETLLYLVSIAHDLRDPFSVALVRLDIEELEAKLVELQRCHVR